MYPWGIKWWYLIHASCIGMMFVLHNAVYCMDPRASS